MREILFRGQTRRYGEKVYMPSGEKVPSNWVYGGIFPSYNGSMAIIYQQEPTIEKFMVYADTVGLFTGLTDKNGVKIFEGDIIKHYNHKDDLTRFDIGEVFWDEKHARFLRTAKDGNTYNLCADASYPYEVITNIYDNPELLK